MELGSVSSSENCTAYNQTVHVIEEHMDRMRQELVSWKKEKANVRSKYYLLTYYTTPQLLFISYELAMLLEHRDRHTQVADSFLMLFEAVNSRVSSEDVGNALSAFLKGQTNRPFPTREPVTSYRRVHDSAGQMKRDSFKKTPLSTESMNSRHRALSICLDGHCLV